MSQRLPDITKWLWCLLALNAGYFWSSTRSVTVRNPPSNPSTIQAQAKFFQDFFSVQLSPYKIEFGHVCEDPNTWEQRYEKKDFKNHRDMGKVRWGDKKGGYGEHYWDLNHAGHAGNHGHGHDDYDRGYDDGSYHDGGDTDNDSYADEPGEQSSSYKTEEYDPENSNYEETGRKKRAYPRVKVERKTKKSNNNEEEHVEEKQKETPRPQKHRRHREQLQTAPTHKVEEYTEEDDSDDDYEPQQTKQKQNEHNEENEQPKRQRNQVILVVSQKEKPTEEPPAQYVTRQPEVNHYVPYEGGAGVRQHQQPEVKAAAPAPRLFLEPSTGHVVDRATGQAYVLQPIAANSNYN